MVVTISPPLNVESWQETNSTNVRGRLRCAVAQRALYQMLLLAMEAYT